MTRYKVYFTADQWRELLEHAPLELANEAVEQQPDLAECVSFEDAPEESLQSMTVADLKKLASEQGIELNGASTKAEIIAAIEAASEETE